MTIEEIIASMPAVITREETISCACCGVEKKVKLKYTLQLSVFRTYGADGRASDHYKAYYMSCDRVVGYDMKYIGEPAGMGERTLSEALLKLKEEIEHDNH